MRSCKIGPKGVWSFAYSARSLLSCAALVAKSSGSNPNSFNSLSMAALAFVDTYFPDPRSDILTRLFASCLRFFEHDPWSAELDGKPSSTSGNGLDMATARELHKRVLTSRTPSVAQQLLEHTHTHTHIACSRVSRSSCAWVSSFASCAFSGSCASSPFGFERFLSAKHHRHQYLHHQRHPRRHHHLQQ